MAASKSPKGKSDAKSKVIEMCKKNKVRFVRLWFSDVLGRPKSFAFPVEELKTALNEGMGFDGSSIAGFARIEESDMIAMPDPATFSMVPWGSDGFITAQMFADVLLPDLTPYTGDPRYALKRNIQRAKDMGFTDFYVGPELEYFYFANDKSPETLDRAGYFDLTPNDIGMQLRKRTVDALEKVGIQVEYSHHEVAPSQHEIDLRYLEALAMADAGTIHRIVVKEVAQQAGYYATFMPKPLGGENGSGMHVHMSLFKGKKNAFFDAKDEYQLSADGKHFLAGLLKYAPEFTAVTNQWVNSYKRLVPGYEAPAYVCWGRKNRSAMVRVPMYKPGKEIATRLELRSPDPACNLYLAFSVMLAAGLQGIEDKEPLRPPVEEDVFALNAAQLKRRRVGALPGNLLEAVKLVEKSKVVKEALGDHIFGKFIENKRIEWNNYRTHVTEWEIDKYLPLL
jgi:glutamine synthetase